MISVDAENTMEKFYDNQNDFLVLALLTKQYSKNLSRKKVYERIGSQTLAALKWAGGAKNFWVLNLDVRC